MEGLQHCDKCGVDIPPNENLFTHNFDVHPTPQQFKLRQKMVKYAINRSRKGLQGDIMTWPKSIREALMEYANKEGMR